MSKLIVTLSAILLLTGCGQSLEDMSILDKAEFMDPVQKHLCDTKAEQYVSSRLHMLDKDSEGYYSASGRIKVHALLEQHDCYDYYLQLKGY